jgi:hypothetical protein
VYRLLSLVAVAALPAAGCILVQDMPLTDGGFDAGGPTGCASPTGTLSVSPLAIDFGDVIVKSVASQIVAVANCTDQEVVVTPGSLRGPQFMLFTTSRNAPFTLAAGSSASVIISYAPLAPSQMDSASLDFFFNDGTSATVTVQGISLVSGLKITPNPLNFAFVQPGKTLALPVHLTNVGNVTLNVTSASIVDPGTPAAFSLPAGSFAGGSLMPGASVNVTVVFAPPQAGKYSGELDISSTDSVNVVPVLLTGYGGGAIIGCSPLQLDFGTVAAGIGSALPVICTNTGTDVPGHPEAGVILTRLLTDNPIYSAQVDPQTPNPASASQPLAAGLSTLIDVIYLPTSASQDDLGTLTINSNVTDGTSTAPPTVFLKGTAVVEQPCMYAVTPPSIDFGPVAVGMTVTSGFTLTDTGTTECLVTGLGIGAGCSTAFALPSGAITSQRLSAGDAGPYPNTLSVSVTFTPPDAGLYQCTLEFFGADSGIPITGTGTE